MTVQPGDAQTQQPGDVRLWMVLEDDFSLRSLLEEMFKMWGRKPMTFADGYRAMTWLDEVEAGRYAGPLPEVALLDVRVPGPQGPEIAHRLRSVPATSQIPIVIMTAYRVDEYERDQIVETAKPNAFIHKGEPIFDMLQDLLERVVREAKERKAASATPPQASSEPAKAASPEAASAAPATPEPAAPDAGGPAVTPAGGEPAKPITSPQATPEADRQPAGAESSPPPSAEPAKAANSEAASAAPASPEPTRPEAERPVTERPVTDQPATDQPAAPPSEAGTRQPPGAEANNDADKEASSQAKAPAPSAPPTPPSKN